MKETMSKLLSESDHLSPENSKARFSFPPSKYSKTGEAYNCSSTTISKDSTRTNSNNT
jgi:hypothetical protein